MSVGVLMMHENISFMIIILQCVGMCQCVNVIVSGSDSMYYSILSVRSPLCMMATIEAHHSVCVIVIRLSQDTPVCSVMVMAGISVISALEFLCV